MGTDDLPEQSPANPLKAPGRGIRPARQADARPPRKGRRPHNSGIYTIAASPKPMTTRPFRRVFQQLRFPPLPGFVAVVGSPHGPLKQTFYSPSRSSLARGLKRPTY